MLDKVVNEVMKAAALPEQVVTQSEEKKVRKIRGWEGDTRIGPYIAHPCRHIVASISLIKSLTGPNMTARSETEHVPLLSLVGALCPPPITPYVCTGCHKCMGIMLAIDRRYKYYCICSSEIPVMFLLEGLQTRCWTTACWSIAAPLAVPLSTPCTYNGHYMLLYMAHGVLEKSKVSKRLQVNAVPRDRINVFVIGSTSVLPTVTIRNSATNKHLLYYSLPTSSKLHFMMMRAKQWVVCQQQS